MTLCVQVPQVSIKFLRSIHVVVYISTIFLCMKVKVKSLSYVCLFETLWAIALYPTRLLCPWDFPGKNTGVGCHFLLQSLPDPGIELRYTFLADSLLFEPWGNPHFAWMDTIPLYRYITTYLSIQDFMEVWIISIFFSIVNGAALNIYVHIFLNTCFQFSDYIIKSGIAGLYSNSILNFLRNWQLFSTWLYYLTFHWQCK